MDEVDPPGLMFPEGGLPTIQGCVGELKGLAKLFNGHRTSEVELQDIENKREREASVWHKEVRDDCVGSPTGAFNAKDSDMVETDFRFSRFNNAAIVVGKNTALA